MPDEQQMKPSEPEQTARPEPAAQPEPAASAGPPQPTQEDAQPAESADRDAQPPQAEQPAVPAGQTQPPRPAEHAPEQASDEQAQPPQAEQRASASEAQPSHPADQPAPEQASDEPAQPPASDEPASGEPASASDAGADADAEAGAEGPSLDEVIRERDDVKAEAEGPSLDEVIRERDYWRLTAAELKTKLDRTESENSEKIKPGDLLGDLLPVADDLERALAADTRDGDAYRRGVEGVHRKLLNVMARRGVAPIDALGADFDPNLHEAMTSEPADGRRDGEVVEELRRGYTLRGKLLRASMVKVAKA